MLGLTKFEEQIIIDCYLRLKRLKRCPADAINETVVGLDNSSYLSAAAACLYLHINYPNADPREESYERHE